MRTNAHVGQIIADLYRLEEPLGRGAMGSIWRAEQLRLKSKVALKFLDPAISDDPETFNRFMREAQSAAAVRGAHVVQIFDCGIDEGTPYISMELLHGESLDKRLAARTTLTAPELDKIFTEVARAVDTAHEFGVIHRDLKPGNIFLARERDREITKVLDFGIAKLMNAATEVDSASGTRTGTMLGTPYYMSPEQVRGSRALDQRTDLWSLAIIAYECLTGQLPFRGDSMGDIVVQICTAKPTPPSALSAVPAGFDEWFAKGTSREPSARYATAQQMAERLSEILALAPDATTAAKSSRASLSGAAGTLQSAPGPSAVDPRATNSSAHARSSASRGRMATAVLAETRVPQSGSTRPLTAPIPPASPRWAFVEQLRRGRRWSWAAAPASVLSIASAFYLWPSDPEGEHAERWPAAAGSLSPAAGDARPVVARQSDDGATSSRTPLDAPEKRAALEPTAEPPLANEIRREPAPPMPREEPAPDLASEPSPEADDVPAIDVESMDADALEPTSSARVKRAKAAASAKGRRHSARRSSSKTRKKAAASESAEMPSAAPARSEGDPFAERR